MVLKFGPWPDYESVYAANAQAYLRKEKNKAVKGQAQRAVMDLVNHSLAGYRITADNFYTSLKLADKL